MRSENSSNGAVQDRDLLSIRPWSPGTGSLSNSSVMHQGNINLRRATVRRLAYKAADCGLLSADLAAGIRRVTETQTASSEMGRLVTFGRELGSSSLGAFTRHNPAQTKTETAAVSESPKNGAMSCGFGCAPSLQRPFSVEERREMDSM